MPIFKTVLNVFALQKAPAIVISAGVALIAALVLQHLFAWEPCPLCILQRLAVIGVLAGSGLAWVIGGEGSGRKGALVVTGAFTLSGILACLAHLWVLWGPASQSCGPSLKQWVGAMVEALPGSGWLFSATADCALASDTLLGLPLPCWALLLFSLQFGLLFLNHRGVFPAGSAGGNSLA